MKTYHIPEQKAGNQSDAVSQKCYDSSVKARNAFDFLVEKLKTVRNWKNYSEDISAEFYLTDASGNLITGPPENDYHIRIDLPAPGNPSGDGYDWVKIISLQDGTEQDHPYYAITVTPTTNPNEPQPENVAHFYEDEATNTFAVWLDKDCVKVSVHGRNEKANIKEGSLKDRARNVMIGIAGVFGLGKVQWSIFTDAMIAQLNGITLED
jgi:hypothetical protein